MGDGAKKPWMETMEGSQQNWEHLQAEADKLRKGLEKPKKPPFITAMAHLMAVALAVLFIAVAIAALAGGIHLWKIWV